MKKLMTLVILAVVAYSAFWFYGANKGKAYIEQKLKEANIQYDAISLSGYPLNFGVTLKNPKWERENIQSSSKGNMTLSSFIFGNKFTINRDGEVDVKISNVANPISLKLIGDTDITFETTEPFSLHHNSLPIEFSEGNPLLILEKFKSANMVSKNLHVELEDKLERKSFNIDSLILSWSQKLSELSQTHYLSFNIRGLNKNLTSDLSLSLIPYGADVLDFDGEFTIPKENINLALLPEMSFKVNKFDSISNMGTGSFHGLFQVKRKDDNNKGFELNFVSKSSMPESGYSLFVKEFMASLKESAKENAQLSELLKNHEEEIIGVIPKFYQLSPIEMDVDMNGSVNEQSYATTLNIDHANLSMAPYSIYKSGEISFGDTVHGKLQTKVTHYKILVDDLINYFNKSAALFYKASKNNDQTFSITPDMRDKLLAFLKEISDDPQADNENLTITVKIQDGQTTIGNLNVFEALTKLNAIFAQPQTPQSTP